jgi:hypothetical protein
MSGRDPPPPPPSAEFSCSEACAVGCDPEGANPLDCTGPAEDRCNANWVALDAETGCEVVRTVTETITVAAESECAAALAGEAGAAGTPVPGLARGMTSHGGLAHPAPPPPPRYHHHHHQVHSLT